MSKTKKIIILAIMLVLLAATAILNYTIAAGGFGGGKDGDVVPIGNFFTSYRNERIATRNMEIAHLDSIIATQGDEFASARAEAAEQKIKLSALTTLENLVEHLLIASGFEDAVVTMSTTSSNVNVIVKSDLLTPQDNAIIYMTLYEEANINPNFVRIIPI